MAPTRLEQALGSGRFALTAELGPPKHADAGEVIGRAAPLAAVCHAINVTDNQTAQSRMAPLAAARLVIEAGGEPVMQLTVRDRNRLALTSDLLGASALGVHNTLSMGGDPIHLGNHPEAAEVRDIDTVQLLRLQAALRSGRFANEADEELAGASPHLVIGATAHPLADDPDVEIQKIRAKMDAGADFFQTQLVYDLDVLDGFLDRLRAAGLPRWPGLLVGVGPLKSHRMARHMHDKVWGVSIPDAVMERMESADDEQAEGSAVGVEILERLRETPGVAGAHVMAIAQEHIVPEVIERAGIAGAPAPLAGH
ncbi:MAG: methylenetetrahydrofolate reductase [Miltoncostaeaceae bacterium]